MQNIHNLSAFASYKVNCVDVKVTYVTLFYFSNLHCNKGLGWMFPEVFQHSSVNVLAVVYIE